MDIGFLLLGSVLLLIGLVFIIPYKVVSRLKGRTEGVIEDMTSNGKGYNYNTHVVETSNEEPSAYAKSVVGHKKLAVGDPQANMYHAVYAYEVNGVKYRRADGVSYNKGNVQKKIGKRVPVYYDPANPEKASLSSGKVYQYLSIGLSSLGVVVLGIGIVLHFL